MKSDHPNLRQIFEDGFPTEINRTVGDNEQNFSMWCKINFTDSYNSQKITTQKLKFFQGPPFYVISI